MKTGAWLLLLLLMMTMSIMVETLQGLTAGKAHHMLDGMNIPKMLHTIIRHFHGKNLTYVLNFTVKKLLSF